MGKKKGGKPADSEKIGLAVNKDLWERFRRLAEESIPRPSLTALLEAAIIEYLDRHEPKTIREGQK